MKPFSSCLTFQVDKSIYDKPLKFKLDKKYYEYFSWWIERKRAPEIKYMFT